MGSLAGGLRLCCIHCANLQGPTDDAIEPNQKPSRNNVLPRPNPPRRTSRAGSKTSFSGQYSHQGTQCHRPSLIPSPPPSSNSIYQLTPTHHTGHIQPPGNSLSLDPHSHYYAPITGNLHDSRLALPLPPSIHHGTSSPADPAPRTSRHTSSG